MALFWQKCVFKLTGPWKGVSAEGRARRGLSVIQILKIDVSVIETKKNSFFEEAFSRMRVIKLLELTGDKYYNVL